MVYLVAFLILLPSIYMFYGLYKKSDFEQKVNSIVTNFNLDQDVVVLNQKINYQSKTVSFATVGKSVSKENVEDWSAKLEKQGYPEVKFEITQSVENLETQNMLEKLKSTYFTTQQILNKKEELLIKQEKEIMELQKQLYLSEKSKIPFDQIANEIKINYNEVVEVAYSRLFKTNFTKIDTVPIIYIKWNNNLNQNQILIQEQKIQKWLRLKLKNEKLIISKLN
jgi:hypothetical protein